MNEETKMSKDEIIEKLEKQIQQQQATINYLKTLIVEHISKV